MRRTRVLAGVLVGAAVLTALALAEVVMVVFFALTVAYVSRPLYRWLRRKGVQRYVASGITTGAVFMVVVALLLPLGMVLYAQREFLLEVLEGIPETLPPISIAGYEYTVEAEAVWEIVVNQLEAAGRSLLGALPRFFLEFMLFTVIVFGVLLGSTRTANAIRGIVPLEYHDVLEAFHHRVEDTLRAIYVVQLATAIVTGLVGLVIFYALGYDQYVTLSVLSGIFQFMPIVGPSIVIVGLAVAEAAAGNYTAAVLVLVLGGVFVAAVPDFVVRPNLASSLADIPATLYFVGFFGGVLTLGIYGAVAGPLVLAVLVEAVAQLSAEQRAGRGPNEPGPAAGPSEGESDGAPDPA